MRATTVQYLEKEVYTVACRNNRASGIILDGQPVFLQDVGVATNFGVDACLFSDTTQAQLGLLVGIAKWNKTVGIISTPNGAAVNDTFEAICYGFTDAIITLRTRATSTDSWSSSPAIAVGDQLAPETVGNGLVRVGTLPSSAGNPVFVAAQSLATQTTQTSNGTLTGGVSSNVADTIRMKVMVRAM
jgi:hypothetical protein